MSEDQERLYDRYLDACVDGAPEPPGPFCERHGVTDATVRARIEALYAEMAPGLPFESLGEFRLVRRIDVGGMGMVFEAEQESLGRRVALKVIRPELKGSGTAAERFRREAQAVARLKHANIVEIHATGEDRGVCYIAMELVEGESLEELLRGAPIPFPRLLRWTADIARALQHAHERGVVHRDVKPANILVAPGRGPRLLDFGIARDLALEDATLTHTFAGSPLYAAPEQITGEPVDARTDVYALGTTLYRALTGRVPFEGGAIDQVIRRVLADEPLPPRRLNPAVSRELETVVLKAIDKEPERRYATAAAFADDLEAILDHRPIRARPPGPLLRARKWCRRHPTLAVAAAVLAVGAAAVLVTLDVQRRREARDALASARAALARYRTEKRETAAFEAELARVGAGLYAQYQPPRVWRSVDEQQQRAEVLRRQRRATFYRVLDLLRRAERLDPGLDGVAETRAELYMDRWREAENGRDDAGMAFFGDLVAKHDPAGRFDHEVHGVEEWRFESEPPGADVFVYRLEQRPESGPRHVAVPLRATEELPWGTVSLRVVRAAGGIEPTDHIVEIAGHPIGGTFLVDEARPPVQALDRLVSVDGQELPSPLEEARRAEPVDIVFERAPRETYTVRGRSLAEIGVTLMTPAECAERGGAPARVFRKGVVTLPGGLRVRATARPLLAAGAAHVGRTPVGGVALPRGEFLVVFRREGYEETRIVRPNRYGAETTLVARLLPEGTTPPGFVFVPDIAGDRWDYWIMDHEVTRRQYLEFARATGRAARAEHLDWPVSGVSWDDAVAYAAWRTARAPPGDTYALPTRYEWSMASHCDEWRFSYGNAFRPLWIKSCRSRRRPFPEPVLSYPIDESPWGVFDTTGSMGEWLDSWFDETRGLRHFAQGCWAYTRPEEFDLRGAKPDTVTDTIGFRLVLRRGGGPR